MKKPIYKRILLKLSGETLMGDKPYGISHTATINVAKEVKAIVDMGVEVAIVIGAGNIFRGMSGSAEGMDRSTADYMGMLATIMNCLTLQDAMEKQGLDTRVLSALSIPEIGEKYIRRRGDKHLKSGRVVICAAGTGNPFFTTDTASALRAAELGCEILIKATKVDGIYDKDPKKHNDAVKYEEISYTEIFDKNLRVMDQTAVALCRENNLPILVFDFFASGNLAKVITGEHKGTIVKNKD